MDVSAFRGFGYDERGWIQFDVEGDMIYAGCCVKALACSAQRVWGDFASLQHMLLRGTLTSCKSIDLD